MWVSPHPHLDESCSEIDSCRHRWACLYDTLTGKRCMVVSTVTRGPPKFARRPALHLVQDMGCAMRMGRVQTSVRCQPLLAADHRVLYCGERQPWAMPGVVFLFLQLGTKDLFLALFDALWNSSAAIHQTMQATATWERSGRGHGNWTSEEDGGTHSKWATGTLLQPSEMAARSHCS